MTRRNKRPEKSAEVTPINRGRRWSMAAVKLFFFAALVAGSTVFAPDLFYDGFEIPKLFFFQSGICLALLAVGVHLRLSGKIRLELPLEAVPLVILFLVAALSITWSCNRWLAVERLFQVGSMAGCFFFAFWLYRGGYARAAFNFVVTAGTLIALWSCLLDFIDPLRQWVYPHYLETWAGGQVIDHYRPLISNQGNPNFTLHVLVLTLPAAFGVLLAALADLGNRRRPVQASVMAGISAIGVISGTACFYLSQNRSGVLSVLFASAVFAAALLVFKRRALAAVLKNYWKKLTLISAAVLVSAAGYLTFTDSGSRLAAGLTTVARERADNWIRRFQSLRSTENIDVYARVVFYETGWAMFEDDPLLGKGIGQFVIQYPRYKTPRHWEKFSLMPPEIKMWELIPSQTHNEYLQVLLETGLVGLAAFLAFVFLLARGAWKSVKSCESGPEFFTLLGFAAGMAGTLANATLTFPLQTVTSSALFWTSAGLVLAPIYRDCRPETSIYRGCRGVSASLDCRRFPGSLLVIAAGLTAAAGLWGAARIVKSQYLFFSGMKVHASELDFAVKTDGQAADLLPYHFEMQYVQGWLAYLNQEDDLAERYFERSIEAAPYFPEPYKYLAEYSYRKGRLAEAEKVLDRYAEVYSPGLPPEYEAMLGLICLRDTTADRLDEAKGHLRKGGGPGEMLYLAERYFLKGMPDTTLALLGNLDDKAGSIYPFYSRYYHILGRAALAVGDTADAVAWLRLVLDDNREESKLYVESARRLLEALGKSPR